MDASQKITQRILEIETAMQAADFWADPAKAQLIIKELQDLKEELANPGSNDPARKYDKGDAIMTIFSGAGGDDAEDFSAMLYRMYRKFCENQGWSISLIHANENDHGGYRNITVEISGKAIAGKGVYGTLKNESGVHRLVRISPFNSKQLRQTSFSMVEIIPKFERTGGKADGSDIELPDKDLEISIAKAGGPGGQNVNKRETAVRIVHIPTKLSVHVTSERSQAQNKEKALDILRGKIFKIREDERMAREKGMYVSKTTSIDWGNQIRSYVLHPYKMVKDHRTNVETSQIDKVLEGDIDIFLN
ncbi:MAG: peptide chain release factor 2, peptide chain release factor 2 [Candidatus Parcubacteria bacterium]|jgi:peptide chain release factor 2